MTPRYLACLQILGALEGGVSNVSGDRGGLTNLGVTQAAYDAWRRSHGLPLQPVTMMTTDEKQQLYWEDYWGPSNAYALPQPLDAAVFDMAVNSGPKQARMTLQGTLNVKQDGVIGPKTLAAIASYKPITLTDMYLDARERFYFDICARDASQKKFLSGWTNRIKRLGHAIGIERS
jgi:lysozyme family protein